MSVAQIQTADAGDTFQGLGRVLHELLIEVRAIRRDPAALEACLDRYEQLLPPMGEHVAALGKPKAGRGKMAPWQENRVKRHVDDNLSDRLSAAELARVVRLSEYHFARAFKATIGCPPHAYVVGRRIAQAKVLMLESEMSLSEVALTCGFADQPHLSRLFRQVVGDSPAAWRRTHLVPTD